MYFSPSNPIFRTEFHSSLIIMGTGVLLYSEHQWESKSEAKKNEMWTRGASSTAIRHEAQFNLDTSGVDRWFKFQRTGVFMGMGVRNDVSETALLLILAERHNILPKNLGCLPGRASKRNRTTSCTASGARTSF